MRQAMQLQHFSFIFSSRLLCSVLTLAAHRSQTKNRIKTRPIHTKASPNKKEKYTPQKHKQNWLRMNASTPNDICSRSVKRERELKNLNFKPKKKLCTENTSYAHNDLLSFLVASSGEFFRVFNGFKAAILKLRILFRRKYAIVEVFCWWMQLIVTVFQLWRQKPTN